MVTLIGLLSGNEGLVTTPITFANLFTSICIKIKGFQTES